MFTGVKVPQIAFYNKIFYAQKMCVNAIIWELRRVLTTAVFHDHLPDQVWKLLLGEWSNNIIVGDMWQAILTMMSQTNGGYTYDYATVPFLAEFMKVKNS